MTNRVGHADVTSDALLGLSLVSAVLLPFLPGGFDAAGIKAAVNMANDIMEQVSHTIVERANAEIERMDKIRGTVAPGGDA